MGERSALVAILVVSFGLKLALLVPAHRTYPEGDARDYFYAARSMVAGDYDSLRPPLWPASIAGSIWLAAQQGPRGVTPFKAILSGSRRAPRPPISDLDLARFVMVVFSTFTVWLVFHLGSALFDRRAGLVAAGLFAFAPSFVGYTHLLYAETQFAMLNVAWMLLLIRGVRAERASLLAAAGVALGLAALTRQLIFSFTLVIVAWLFLLRGRAWRRAIGPAAAFALAAALTIAPWAVRNAFEYRALVPIGPMAGYALMHGITKDPQGEMRRAGVDAAMERGASHLEGERIARAHALGVIRSDPGAYLRRALTLNLPDLWRLGSRVLDNARWGGGEGATRQHGYGGVPPWLGLALIVVFSASYLLFVAAGTIGAALAPRWRETLLTLAMVGQGAAMHTLIGANVRHRLYFMPFVIVYAGFALSRRPTELRALLTRKRAVWAATGLALFALLLAAADHAEVREQWRFFRVAARIEATR